MNKSFTYIGLLVGFILIMGQGCVSFGSNQSGSTGPAGMFLSTDRGDSWKQINVMPKSDGTKSISGVSVYRIFEDPEDPKTMYLATREHGMFFSYDEGITWQQPYSVLNQGFVYSIAVHPKDKCLIYATNGLQIFRSDDCNRSWTEMYREARSDVRIVSVVFNPFSPYQILMGESNGDVFRSEDEGQSWMPIKRFNTRLSEIMADPLQQNVYYAAMRTDGLQKTIDGGENWVSLKDRLKPFSGSTEYRRMVLNPNKNGVLYWISTYGILRSEDGGENWQSYNLITPPGSANIYGFAINPKNDNEIYYTATINSRSTFYKSQDGGQNWITKKIPSGQLPTALRVRPDKENVLYMGFTIPPKQQQTNQSPFFQQ